MSYNLTLSLSSDFLSPLPIDCRTRITDLDGDANIILWMFLMLIPVEHVPYEAIRMAFFSSFTIFRIFSL